MYGDALIEDELGVTGRFMTRRQVSVIHSFYRVEVCHPLYPKPEFNFVHTLFDDEVPTLALQIISPFRTFPKK